MKSPYKVSKEILNLISQKQSVKIDVGCGENKQSDDWIGIDYRKLKEVDIVWNLEKFPWPIPNESASTILCSHILEHIKPTTPDVRLTNLIKLLTDKKLLTEKEIQENLGDIDIGPIFIRFMN